MYKEHIRKIASGLFLFIFFAKMVISVAPLLVLHFDEGSVRAVIMQIEIENNENTETVKEVVAKKLWCNSGYMYSFLLPVQYLSKINFPAYNYRHIQSFYPSVPTPPPNTLFLS